MMLSRMMKSHAILLCLARSMNRPFVQHIHSVYAPCLYASSHLVDQIDCWGIKSARVQVTLIIIA